MSDLKETAKRLFLQTLETIRPEPVIRQKLKLDGATLSLGSENIDLDVFSEVVLIGMGKASITMGAAVESLLGDRVGRGILVSDHAARLPLRSEVIVAGHPVPDSNSLKAGKKTVELVQSCGGDSLLIFLISGGGSSLVELPLSDDVSVDDLRQTNRLLVGCGASIREINIVRKNLSRIKGGRLGYLARNSRCIGLYISDVNPGDIRSIASNPLLPEELVADELQDVLASFNLGNKLPRSVATVINEGKGAGFDYDHEWSGNRQSKMLLLDNSDAIEAARSLAVQLGFQVEVDEASIEGDYRSVAEHSIEQLLRLRETFSGKRVCLLSGGEVSCRVRGSGVGGRNQEFVLYCAAKLAGLGIDGEAVVLSCGTDGIDGNSKAAGAVADADLVVEAARHGDDASAYISNSDSYSFFKKRGGLVVTGPTGNNVRDLRILMAQ